jgi:hypothetical protein
MEGQTRYNYDLRLGELKNICGIPTVIQNEDEDKDVLSGDNCDMPVRRGDPPGDGIQYVQGHVEPAWWLAPTPAGYERQYRYDLGVCSMGVR